MLPGAARGMARVVRARANGGVRAVLVVARPVGDVTGQVGGIVIAELITGGALILLRSRSSVAVADRPGPVPAQADGHDRAPDHLPR